MQASEVFNKTPKGLSEIENKSNDLSLKERRVLILVNGENNTARLKQLSLCENIAEILDNLIRLGFIEHPHGGSVSASNDTGTDTNTSAAAAPVAKDEPSAAAEISAREFMCNTLLTFANRVRVARLVEEINAVEDIAGLKDQIKPWYHAISETPGGMYQVDDLRKDLNKMIENEEINGLR